MKTAVILGEGADAAAVLVQPKPLLQELTLFRAERFGLAADRGLPFVDVHNVTQLRRTLRAHRVSGLVIVGVLRLAGADARRPETRHVVEKVGRGAVVDEAIKGELYDRLKTEFEFYQAEAVFPFLCARKR